MINKINMIHQNRKEMHDLSLSKQMEARNSQMLAENEQIIQNLNKKIDRRLNIGYYCEVPNVRRERNYHHRKIYVAVNNHQQKKKPVLKRKKKEQKVVFVDCQQNTDQLQFTDDFQNTSRLYTEKKVQPDMEDTEMQWSYEVQKINQESQCHVQTVDGSMQFQFVEVQDMSIQYENPEEIIVELKETSIQYDLFQEEKEQIVVEDKEMQCQKVEKAQPKPIVLQKNLQIDLPDLNNIQKMEQLQQILFKAQKQKQRQIKISKAFKSKMEMLKLKQEVAKIQSQIQIAQLNNKSKQSQKELQRQLQTQRSHFLKQRKRDLGSMNKHFENQVSGLINSLKSKEKASKNEISSLPLIQKEKEDANMQKSVARTKEQLEKIKNDLKEQMKKRMRYQSEQEYQDQKLTSLEKLNRYQNSSELSSIKMKNLFPNPQNGDRLFVGTIIKNISHIRSPNKSSRDHQYRMANIARAYCERRLEVSELLNKRDKSLNADDNSIIEDNPGSILQKRDLRSSSTGFYKNPNKLLPNVSKSKYTRIKQAKVLGIQQVKSLENKIKTLHQSEICLKYLYKQQQKMVLGNQLFKIFNPQLIIRRQIQIIKFKEYLVYTYHHCQATCFVIFYHSLNYVFYGQQPKIINNPIQYFSNPTLYKDYWGIQYSSGIISYNGEYQRGQKHGLGLQILENNIYQGCFQYDIKTGKGKNIFQNQDQYEGEFQNNLAHGEGIYYWKNGEKYEGFFQNGKKHGYGKHIYPNGDTFEGFYSNNVKQGRGRCRWNDGKVYEGQYKNDLKCGQGKITNPDESYFIGIWSEDICTYVCRKIGAKRTKNFNEANNIRINF